MSAPFRLVRSSLPVLTLALVLGLAACGDDDSGSAPDDSAAERSTADLGAIKGYLLEHTVRLKRDTAEIRRGAERYYRLAKAAGFDYPRLLRSYPSYEEMEGIVAGVPQLVDYDVIIDAGGDASDPENAVPFNIETPDGRTFKQPGNFNYLIETDAFGTEPTFQAKGVTADLDGDGVVRFGESLPDAGFYVAAAREFE